MKKCSRIAVSKQVTGNGYEGHESRKHWLSLPPASSAYPMAWFPSAGGGASSIFSQPPSRRQHPLLLWFDLLDTAGYDAGPQFLYYRYWLSLGAYYLLLFACAWFVLQWFRRGRPWATARSFLAGISKGGVGGWRGGVKKDKKRKKIAVPPLLLYKESSRNRRLLSKTTVLRQPYVPSPWLGHRVSDLLCFVRRVFVLACLLGFGRLGCFGDEVHWLKCGRATE